MATKRIKFIKPWMMVPAGAERDFEAPIADLLIKNGRAKEVQALAPTPAVAPVSKRALRKALKKASNANR